MLSKGNQLFVVLVINIYKICFPRDLKKCKRKANNSGEFANMNPDKNTFKHILNKTV